MIAATIISALSACSSEPVRALQNLLDFSKGAQVFEVGLKQYEDGKYAEAARNLQLAIDRGLSERQRADAHKHLAFIHCTSNRERACRDEFRKALAIDPALNLKAAEIGHPVWGPIFTSLTGVPVLSTGIRQFEEGNYVESAKNLQGAIERGLALKERATAHKHLAFIHCASNRERACAEEFRRALAADPAMELAPAEVGHPVWGPVFRSVKAGR